MSSKLVCVPHLFLKFFRWLHWVSFRVFTWFYWWLWVLFQLNLSFTASETIKCWNIDAVSARTSLTELMFSLENVRSSDLICRVDGPPRLQTGRQLRETWPLPWISVQPAVIKPNVSSPLHLNKHTAEKQRWAVPPRLSGEGLCGSEAS